MAASHVSSHGGRPSVASGLGLACWVGGLTRGAGRTAAQHDFRQRALQCADTHTGHITAAGHWPGFIQHYHCRIIKTSPKLIY